MLYCLNTFNCPFSGIILWATLWLVFQEAVMPGSSIFNLSVMVAAGYAFGHTLERYTTINAMAGMTLVGVLFKIFGNTNFIDDPIADTIDYHLRYVKCFNKNH